MMHSIRLFLASFCLIMLAACGSDNEHQDLLQYMAEQKRQTGGDIEALPTAQPYKTAKYEAFLLRSPFDEPELVVAGRRKLTGEQTVKPDPNRVREYLEEISFSSFSLVGSISQSGQVWSLLNDGSGTIHRVTVGNYLGKNHGRITSINRDKLDVVEIVSDGKGGWLKKPRILSLDVKE